VPGDRHYAGKSVLGLKTALRLRIETVGGATRIDAGIGLLESQAVPTAVTMLVFWPALVTQSWGLVPINRIAPGTPWLTDI
jgi:hypothetical protein